LGGDGADTLVFLSGAAVNASTKVSLDAGADSVVFLGNTLSGQFGGGAGADTFSGSVTIGASGVSFWGGADNDTFSFSQITGANNGTAYFWNESGTDSIVFASQVSASASGNAAGVFFGITSGSSLAISFATAQTTGGMGVNGISNLFQVGPSNLVTYGVGSSDLTLVFASGSVISLQGFSTAEMQGLTNTFGSAGTTTALFGSATAIPTFS
jgi:hypothetical protein